MLTPVLPRITATALRVALLLSYLLIALPTARVLADDATNPAAYNLSKLVVISDDDFLTDDSPSWCFRSLDKAVAACRHARSHSELTVKFIAAGSPGILTKDLPKTAPRRAICFICNANNQINAFCVGVPTASQLLTLVEDAEELSIIASIDSPKQAKDLETEHDSAVVTAIRERVATRTLRHYRPLLASIHQGQSLTIAADLLQPALLKDIGERFLLTEPIEYQRLVGVQQHAEACRYWCDAMMPCVVGKPVDEVWPLIAAIVWSGQPWRVEVGIEPLTKWYDETIASGPVILTIDTEKLFLDQVTKRPSREVDSVQAAERQARKLSDLKTEINGIEHRTVDLAELATILAHRRDAANDLLISSTAPPAWVVIESRVEKPIFIAGEGDSRLLSILQRLRLRLK